MPSQHGESSGVDVTLEGGDEGRGEEGRILTWPRRAIGLRSAERRREEVTREEAWDWEVPGTFEDVISKQEKRRDRSKRPGRRAKPKVGGV